MLAYDYMKNRILVTKIDQTIFKELLPFFHLSYLILGTIVIFTDSQQDCTQIMTESNITQYP
jgi:hypothetical protein